MNGGKQRKRESLVSALLQCRTLEDAAQASGLSLRTVKRWLADQDFRDEYKAARRRLVESATGHLRAAMGRACDVLDAVANDPAAAVASRVSAARTIIELALRSHEVEDLEDRITELEKALREEKR